VRAGGEEPGAGNGLGTAPVDAQAAGAAATRPAATNRTKRAPPNAIGTSDATAVSEKTPARR